MKTLIPRIRILCTIVCLFFTSIGMAQTTLSPGDIMIIALNAYNSTENEFASEGSADEFMFVLLEPVTSGTEIYFTDFGYIGNTQPFFQTNFNTGQCVSTPLSGDRGDVSSGLIKWTATSALPAGTKVIIRTGGSTGAGVLATSVGSVVATVYSQTAGIAISLTTAGETLHAFQGTLDGNNIPTSVTVLTALRYRTSWQAPTWQCHYTPSISGNPNTGFDVVHTVNPDNMIYTGPLTGAKADIQDSIQDVSKWNTSTSNNPFNFTPVSASAPSIAITSSTNILCNGASTGSITATVTGGTSNYTYVWSNGSSTANTSSLTNTVSSLSAGYYKVVVTDNNGLKDSTDITLTEPTSLGSSAVVDSNVSCHGFSDGGATVSVTGGTMPYSYSWNNSATTASITGVVAGKYMVTISDANGCSVIDSVTITEPVALVASTIVDSNASCYGFSDGGATVSATGGTGVYSYLWSNGATTASITGVVAGTYNVTVTDANGCTSMSSATVTQPLSLGSSVVVDSNTSCHGFSDGGATVSATGGTMPYSYAWSNSATTASITGVVAGKYMVTISDANGCSVLDSVTITEPLALSSSVVLDSNVSCNGDMDGGATASVTGGTMPYSYSWSNSATTASITGVVAGKYMVTISDANGCSVLDSVTIAEPVALVASTTVDSNVSCNGYSDGGATVSATGGTGVYSYLWSNGATTASITGVVAGTYNVTVTDANGCTSMSSATVTQPVSLGSSVVVDSNVSCHGFSDGGATALGSGGTMPYSYAWSNSATTASITGVVAGKYMVTISDANGCSVLDSVIITEPLALSSSVVLDSNVSCHGFSDGGATASVTGGTMPYSYSWSNSATTASITGVVAGKYMVTISDANGCSVIDSVTVTEPDLSGSTDTVKATDSYEWMDGVTYTESIYGPTYTLTDVNGCDSVITLDLTIVNYCASRSTRNRFEWIKQVELEDDIDNLSNADAGGYGDYTDQILIVDTGDVVTVALTPGYKRRAYDEYWRIWADWNYDGDFNDAGEKVFEQKGKNLQTGSFTIPVDVDANDLGLRVSMRWKKYAPSCGNFSSGEVEDYTIRVQGAQGYSNPLVTRTTLNEDADVSSEDLYEFIDVYPNPVIQGDVITGFVRVSETGSKHIQLVNILGQVIKSEVIVCDEEENRFEISTVGLTKGVYFMNINSGGETTKIVVR